MGKPGGMVLHRRFVGQQGTPDHLSSTHIAMRLLVPRHKLEREKASQRRSGEAAASPDLAEGSAAIGRFRRRIHLS